MGRVELLSQHRIERLHQALARRDAVHGRVFVSVRDPDVGHARRAQRLPERRPDAARGDAVVDPELADGRIGAGEREARRGLRVREARRVEVDAVVVGPGPVAPGGEVLGPQLVAVDALAAGLGVHGVQVEAMRAGEQLVDLVEVGAQLVGRARLAGVVSGGRDAARERLARVLEAADVVALPAVQAERNRRERRQRRLGVHTELGVAFAGKIIGALDVGAGRGRGHGATSKVTL